jgi:hypothetical protein
MKMSTDRVNRSGGIPLLLKLELELETLDLDLALAFVLENALVGLSVLRGRCVPGAGPILGGLMGAQTRQVADNVAICAASEGSARVVDGKQRTSLPRGVVSPIPLYMVVQRRDHGNSRANFDLVRTFSSRPIFCVFLFSTELTHELSVQLLNYLLHLVLNADRMAWLTPWILLGCIKSRG